MSAFLNRLKIKKAVLRTAFKKYIINPIQ